MKVRDCEKCGHSKRLVWTQRYKPGNYHTIGLNHAYCYCTKANERCALVRRCPLTEENKKEEPYI